jgi:outer membrane protein assembly factor BamA
MTKRANKMVYSLVRIVYASSFLIFITLLASCTGTKYLKENETFYTGARVTFHQHGRVAGKKNMKEKLGKLIGPKPNSTLLGSRPGVWIYYITGTSKNKKGFASWMRKKFGQEPVLITDARPERTAKILQGNLFNNGFFESQVSASVHTKRKKSRINYDVELYPPFFIKEIHVPDDSIFQSKDDDVMKVSLLKPGDRYSLEMLKNEQSRIERVLEDLGYYHFDNRFVLFEADTTVGDRKVEVYLTYSPEMPEKALQRYSFRNVNVINDHSLWQAGTDSAVQNRRDTILIDRYRYSSVEDNFRPEIITNAINIESGMLYSRKEHNYSISHLMGLGTFKFVNIKYREADSAQVDADIFLTPLLKKSIRLEVQGITKSNNFVGPGIGATFTNRNFLRGAEQFQFKLNGSYEVQISQQQSQPLNALELSAEVSLSVPRLISPIRISHYSTKYIPHTSVRIGSTFQRRIKYYQLNSFNVGYGYLWRETTTKSHELYPIDINYVKVSRQSEEFAQLLEDNPYLKNSFQDQFIPAMRYSFTLNTQLRDPGEVNYNAIQAQRLTFYLNANFSLSGNIINAIAKGLDSSGDVPRQVFSEPYSQFVLGDIDFRSYWQIDQKNRLVARIALGSGYAYGNSGQLPYIKQFASGGSNSIRAFQARSIGPGTYGVGTTDSTYFIDQRGDIKLEANAEYRFDIFKAFKGAVFLDAGNIWLWNEDPQRPGGKFNTDTFLKELAVGTGFGLRLDFNFFILRFDLAFPLRKPYLPDGERWVFDKIDFGSKAWRRENLVLNIAIGYPF